jgi:hypothetical protein
MSVIAVGVWCCWWIVVCVPGGVFWMLERVQSCIDDAASCTLSDAVAWDLAAGGLLLLC